MPDECTPRQRPARRLPSSVEGVGPVGCAPVAAAELIEQADAIVIAAGAGMGVDSGLPDFRGNEGFWKAYPALAT